MGEYADEAINRYMGLDGYFTKPMRLAKKDVTCRTCGASCYWQETIQKKGEPKIRLFSGGSGVLMPIATPGDDEVDEVLLYAGKPKGVAA